MMIACPCMLLGALLFVPQLGGMLGPDSAGEDVIIGVLDKG